MNIFKQGRMKFFIITGLIPLFFNFYNICGAVDLNDAKRGIVKITVHKPIDWIETGTGIILSEKDKRLYILTAYHVIENFEQIDVEFYEKLDLILQGKFLMSDKENDIAVICVEDIEQHEIGARLELGNISKLKVLDPIVTIGHPGAYQWEPSKGEIRSIDSSIIRFTGEIIDPGNSGGPLLNDKFQLIGMIIKEDGRDGIALKIDIVFEIINSRKIIPIDIKHQTLLSLIKQNKKWLLIGGGVAITTVISWFLFREGKEKRGEDLPTPPGMPN